MNWKAMENAVAFLFICPFDFLNKKTRQQAVWLKKKNYE